MRWRPRAASSQRRGGQQPACSRAAGAARAARTAQDFVRRVRLALSHNSSSHLTRCAVSAYAGGAVSRLHFFPVPCGALARNRAPPLSRLPPSPRDLPPCPRAAFAAFAVLAVAAAGSKKSFRMQKNVRSEVNTWAFVSFARGAAAGGAQRGRRGEGGGARARPPARAAAARPLRCCCARRPQPPCRLRCGPQRRGTRWPLPWGCRPRCPCR